MRSAKCWGRGGKSESTDGAWNRGRRETHSERGRVRSEKSAWGRMLKWNGAAFWGVRRIRKIVLHHCTPTAAPPHWASAGGAEAEVSKQGGRISGYMCGGWADAERTSAVHSGIH